ncbi:hypothetical protein THAOC_29421, partial [Thalassiosira oceanica]
LVIGIGNDQSPGRTARGGLKSLKMVIRVAKRINDVLGWWRNGRRPDQKELWSNMWQGRDRDKETGTMNRLVSSRAVRSMVTRCSSASRGGTSAATRPLVSSFASTVRLPLVPHQRRCLSSHDDFAPKKKHDVDGGDDDAVLGMIDSHVKGNRVMLYMKGSPNQPMCGFSATVVGILKNSGADFASVNVLDYPEHTCSHASVCLWYT